MHDWRILFNGFKQGNLTNQDTHVHELYFRMHQTECEEQTKFGFQVYLKVHFLQFSKAWNCFLIQHLEKL